MLIDGAALSGLADRELTLLRRRSIGFVFQFFNLLLDADREEENVVLPLELAGEEPDSDWVDELLGKVGLADRRHHRPAELSGGQTAGRDRPRARHCRPAIVFADEPTRNLDSKSGGEILELLRVSSHDYGQTILTVTHEPRVSAVADRITCSRTGSSRTQSRRLATALVGVIEEAAAR